MNEQRQRSSVRSWKLWIVGWLPAGVGLISWIAAAFNLGGPDAPLRVLGLFTCVAISVIVHEVAHFVVAQKLGLRPWCLSIGHGDVVFDKQYDQFRLILRMLPYSGAVYPFVYAAQAHRTRWRELAMVSAGPLANAVLLGIFWLIASRSAEWLMFTAMPMQMLLANGYLLIMGLVPHYAEIDGARVPNDGLHLVHLAFRRPAKVGRGGHEANATGTDSPGPSWTWALKQLPPEVLLAQYRQQLHESKLSSDERHLILDSFATCVLMYGTSEFLAEADRYSEELFRSKPDSWTVKGTRGSILIERGELERGSALLQQVMQQDPSSFDRAIAASFLALAELKQNDREAAEHWLRISRDLDPHCPSMQRIEALFRAKVSPIRART